MRYFVTGATGFIGGKLALELIRRGHQVVTVARSPAKAGALVAAGVEVFKGDITDKSTLAAPMQNADGVFHVAGWYKVGLRDSSEGQAINVEGTRSVLEVMRDLRIKKGVYTSTLAVNSDTRGQIVDETYHFHGTHLSEYDRTKAEAHAAADSMIRAGLPLVIVMPGMVIGPDDTSVMRQTLIDYLNRRLPMIPAGQAMTWAHVDDIVEGHILAMEKGTPGETYIIAGEVHTFTAVMDAAERLTGIPAPRLRPPRIVMQMTAGLMGIIDHFIPLEGQFSPEMLRILAGATYIATNAKARRELGYNPRSMELALRQTLEHEMKLAGK